MIEIIDKLFATGDVTDDELALLIECKKEDVCEYLYQRADAKRRLVYGTDVYIRGLIEFTNYCKNNCFYCGIRAGNCNTTRYRLSKEDIIECCKEGYELGFRTFVLQGGEDPYFTDDIVVDIVSTIKSTFPECAITLSIGEKSRQSYQAYYDAGAERYLLRHETADKDHYRKLHPAEMSWENRRRCLYDLKEIGYQVGAGFMVGSPYQSTDCLVKDIRFLQKLEPDMVGIGPFIRHSETPFMDMPNGTLDMTLKMLAILRLILNNALLPATTALGTIHPEGRVLGLKAGANVVMPNLSPVRTRKLYELYENKICTGEESAQCRVCLKKQVEAAGYRVVVSRGDAKKSSV